MTRRRLVALIGLSLLTLLGGAVVAHLQIQGKRSTCGQAAYRAIRKGMTLEEVSALIGLPPEVHVEEGRLLGGRWLTGRRRGWRSGASRGPCLPPGPRSGP